MKRLTHFRILFVIIVHRWTTKKHAHVRRNVNSDLNSNEHTRALLPTSITTEMVLNLQSLTSDVFWQRTYEQHAARSRQRELCGLEMSGSSLQLGLCVNITEIGFGVFESPLAEKADQCVRMSASA